MFSRVNVNRSAAFLIFNAHYEQTRDDKEDSELKQTSRVSVIILLRGYFLCRTSEIYTDFRTKGNHRSV